MIFNIGPYFQRPAFMRKLFEGAICVAALLSATPATAHVKWFVPHVIEAAPEPIATTLGSAIFWIGVAATLVLFMAARAIEKTPVGDKIYGLTEMAMIPLSRDMDHIFRLILGAFMVAIFTQGGIYLTDDLVTEARWISWLQLLIAVLIFPRATRPLAGAGIMALWLLALREYDLFHMLDYLGLNASIAAYFIMEASRNPEWRRHRFTVLRWGIALALMWLSIEKFAYPDRFDQMIGENPPLPFGLDYQAFIISSGIVEFALAFGLIWTPLIRRLSALALLMLFGSATIMFGRPDLIGHAAFIAIFLTCAADPSKDNFLEGKFPRMRSLGAVPVGLVLTFLFFAASHWGSHGIFYGAGNQITAHAE